MSEKFRKEIEWAIIKSERMRNDAAERQALLGNSDQGLRSQVTSGGHLDELVETIARVFIDAGISPEGVFTKRRDVILPGYFRPEKSWDVLAIHDGKLIAAIEVKSIWGSYGNNMNNRTEEAIGSGFDLRTANAYKLYGDSVPWVGYVFIIRDSETIHCVNKFSEPHFPVDSAYEGTGYLRRSMVMCRRLMQERIYDRVFYAVYEPKGSCLSEPDSDMTWAKFEAAIRGKVSEALA